MIELDNASVLFADLVGYTAASTRALPTETMRLLDSLYKTFDQITTDLKAYKLDTIGGEWRRRLCRLLHRAASLTSPVRAAPDAYMCATGLSFMNQPDHVDRLLLLGAELIKAASLFSYPGMHTPVAIRVGMATGAVASGILGTIRRKYTITGSVVNMASRLESGGTPGFLHVSAEVMEASRIPRHLFERVVSHVKGMGEVTTYLLSVKDAELAESFLGTGGATRRLSAPGGHISRPQPGKQETVETDLD